MNVTTPSSGVLGSAPDNSASAKPFDETCTETKAVEPSTGFPEISLRVTTGTWVIPSRFTAPAASAVKSISVATPCVSVTVDGSDARDKLTMEAVTVFGPISPTNFKPLKVAMPSIALSVKSPVRSVPAKVTIGVPVVTGFSLASNSSTKTSESVWSFAALS